MKKFNLTYEDNVLEIVIHQHNPTSQQYHRAAGESRKRRLQLKNQEGGN